jgi:hypothetical protein
LLEQPFQPGGDLGVEPGRRQRRLRDDAVQETQFGCRREGMLAGRQFVQDDPQRKDVGGTAHRLGPRLFGGQVAHRADQGPQFGEGRGVAGLQEFGGERTGQAEIDQLGETVRPHHDVLGLDVAMHDPGSVRRRQRLRHLAEQPYHLRQRQALLGQIPQRLAFDPLHDEEGPAAGLADVIQGADEGVVEGGDGHGLAPESLQPPRVFGILPGQELQGDRASQPRVPRLADHAHAAADRRAQDLVALHLRHRLRTCRPRAAGREARRRRRRAARSRGLPVAGGGSLLEPAQKVCAGVRRGSRPPGAGCAGVAGQLLQGLLAGGAALDVRLDGLGLRAGQVVGQQALQFFRRRTTSHGGKGPQGAVGRVGSLPVRSVGRWRRNLTPARALSLLSLNARIVAARRRRRKCRHTACPPHEKRKKLRAGVRFRQKRLTAPVKSNAGPAPAGVPGGMP